MTGRLRAGSEIRLQPNAANALGGGGEGEAKDLFVYNDEQDDAKTGDERDVEWARAARKELARDMLAAYEDESPCYPVGGECERQTCNRIQETKLLVDKEVIQNKLKEHGLAPWSMAASAEMLHPSTCEHEVGKLVPPDKYPLAVKPVKGMKNQGVHLHIQTAETVCEAIREIRGQGTGKGRVLLEQMVADTSLGLRSNGCNAYFVKSTAVHEDLLRRFVDVADILGPAFAGFDFMSDDLRDPSKGFVIDVNSKPDVKMVRDARSQGDGTYFKAGPGSHVSRVVPCWTSTGFYCMCGFAPLMIIFFFFFPTGVLSFSLNVPSLLANNGTSQFTL
ncbi:hypothetical protein TeGR_g12881 [Tetraparma gracilis]|uniref:ATP-grasp domain-containing protein n=1 Tax=Tetraparma gracilis TaxID=2962635 RepID=A0ABQ6MJD4_9STRA|nr:hypothetical protein TeGR_g12881 [Tetraparma gracilis]